MSQRGETIEEIKRLDSLLGCAVMHDEKVYGRRQGVGIAIKVMICT